MALAWLALVAAGLWLSLQVHTASARSLNSDQRAGQIDGSSLLALHRSLRANAERAPKLVGGHAPPALAATAPILIGTLHILSVAEASVCLPTDCKTSIAAQPRAPPPIV